MEQGTLFNQTVAQSLLASERSEEVSIMIIHIIILITKPFTMTKTLLHVPVNSLPHAAAAAAKLLQSCPTLCDPIDGSPPGSPVPGILQARILEWASISFSNA